MHHFDERGDRLRIPALADGVDDAYQEIALQLREGGTQRVIDGRVGDRLQPVARVDVQVLVAEQRRQRGNCFLRAKLAEPRRTLSLS